MCAIAGIISNSSVSAELYDSLIVQQHRGQDASGIMTSEDDAKMHLCKSNGLVQDVFNLENIQGLIGNMGIGHCRYPTAGCASSEEAQPFFR
jgi:amidophosphoribosyltransferase